MDLHFCHFRVGQNITYLKLTYCMFVGYSIVYVQIFFRIFKNQKYVFILF
jgi:hypothetical protein